MIQTKSKASKKARISVILPKKVCQEVREHMLMKGYSLREKSKWYLESIVEFLMIPNFPNYVEMAVYVDQLSTSETFYISEELENKLEEAIVEVRKKYPALEGVKSLIVRASIIQRLLSSLAGVNQ